MPGYWTETVFEKILCSSKKQKKTTNIHNVFSFSPQAYSLSPLCSTISAVKTAFHLSKVQIFGFDVKELVGKKKKVWKSLSNSETKCHWSPWAKQGWIINAAVILYLLMPKWFSVCSPKNSPNRAVSGLYVYLCFHYSGLHTSHD